MTEREPKPTMTMPNPDFCAQGPYITLDRAQNLAEIRQIPIFSELISGDPTVPQAARYPMRALRIQTSNNGHEPILETLETIVPFNLSPGMPWSAKNNNSKLKTWRGQGRWSHDYP